MSTVYVLLAERIDMMPDGAVIFSRTAVASVFSAPETATDKGFLCPGSKEDEREYCNIGVDATDPDEKITREIMEMPDKKKRTRIHKRTRAEAVDELKRGNGIIIRFCSTRQSLDVLQNTILPLQLQ